MRSTRQRWSRHRIGFRWRETGGCVFAVARIVARSMRSGPTTPRRDANAARPVRRWKWGATRNRQGGTGKRASTAGSNLRHHQAAARSSAAGDAGPPPNRLSGPARLAAKRFASRGRSCRASAIPADASVRDPATSVTSAARPAFAAADHAGPPFDVSRCD